MKPDKICVALHQISDYDLDIQEVGHNGAEEYIRKEALLEWARIEKNKCVGNSSWQRFNALQDMIDKLNSL